MRKTCASLIFIITFIAVLGISYATDVFQKNAPPGQRITLNAPVIKMIELVNTGYIIHGVNFNTKIARNYKPGQPRIPNYWIYENGSNIINDTEVKSNSLIFVRRKPRGTVKHKVKFGEAQSNEFIFEHKYPSIQSSIKRPGSFDLIGSGFSRKPSLVKVREGYGAPLWPLDASKWTLAGNNNITINKQPKDNYAYKIEVLGRESNSHRLELGNSPEIRYIAPTAGTRGSIVRVVGTGLLSAPDFFVYFKREPRSQGSNPPDTRADISSFTERNVEVRVPFDACSGPVKIIVNNAVVNSFDFRVENCN